MRRQPLHCCQVPHKPMIALSSLVQRLRCGLLGAGQWCVALALFAAPINKATTSASLLLALLCSVLGTAAGARLRQALRDPVALGMLAWLGLMLASALYALAGGDGGLGLRTTYIWSFLAPLVIATLLQTPQLRWRALYAFAAGIGLVLLISWLMALGAIPQRAIAELLPSMRNTVFKEYTQQGLATLILFSLLMARLPGLPSRRWKVAAAVLAVLAVVNVAVLLGSRTTYLTLVPLGLYWLWVWLRSRGFNRRLVLTTGLAGLAICVAVLQAPATQQRLHSIGSEATLYLEQGNVTSTGVRLWLWQHTLAMVGQAPLLGHGLGQWEPRYLQRMDAIAGSEPYRMGHPHQEMLLVLAEQGIAGLLALLLLIGLLLRLSGRLPPAERHFLRSVVIIYLTAGLANGLIADFTHRNTFVMLLACIPSVALMASSRPPRQDPDHVQH